jgi:hypothetical protein
MKRLNGVAVIAALLLLAGCGGTKTVTVTKTATAAATAPLTTAPPLTPVPGHPCPTDPKATSFYMACAGTAPGQTLNLGAKLGAQSVLGVDTYGDPAPYLAASFDETYVPYSGKGWSRGGLAAWIHAGKQAGLVFEASAAQAENGYSQGVADARYSLSYANALGFPSYTVIYLAVDTETSAASVARYFQGAHAVLGSRTGVYGSYTVVTGLEYTYHLVTPRTMWQTVAWSYGSRSNACLYQASINNFVSGQSVDIDYATCKDFGQFPVSHAPVLPKCFGKHAVGNATCRRVHATFDRYQKAASASGSAYGARGCNGLANSESVLQRRWSYFDSRLRKSPHVRRVHRLEALHATSRALNGVRRTYHGRGCGTFKQRDGYFSEKAGKLYKAYS